MTRKKWNTTVYCLEKLGQVLLISGGENPNIDFIFHQNDYQFSPIQRISVPIADNETFDSSMLPIDHRKTDIVDDF